MRFTKRSQQGFALILVLLIGALMMIPVLMLLSAVAPRRATVTGEAVSDIALASADGVVDKIATKINTFPTLLSSLSSDSYIAKNIGNMTDKVQMAQFTIGYLLSTYLNGYQDTAYSSYQNYMQSYSQLTATQLTATQLPTIQDSVSTYLCDTTTGKYYVVCDTSGYIASVGNVVGASGDVASKPIGDLATVTADGNMNIVSPTGMNGWVGGDSLWKTDNRWIEIDTNTQFSDAENADTTSRFIIRATAYPLSSNKDISGRMRTVQAEVFLGHVKVAASGWTDVATGVFTNAMWSGSTNLLTLNSGPTIKGNVYSAGNIEMPSGGTITGDLQAGGTLTLKTHPTITGNVYAGGSISASTGFTIGGNIQTGGSVTASSSTVGGDYIQATNSIAINGINLSGVQSSWHLLGGNNVLMSTGVGYTQPLQSAPVFDFGATSSAAMSTANTAAGSAGISTYSTSSATPITVGASRSHLPYYVSGDVGTNDITLYFAPIPVADNTVAWYVGGNVTISGSAALNFASPCTIYVGGTLSVSNNTTITGHGTIIANKVLITGTVSGTGQDPKIAIIATGTDNPALYVSSGVTGITAVMYAPIGTVRLPSGGTITGSIVAKNVDASGSAVNITYDNSLTTDSPPLPGPPSVSFTFTIGSSTAFKRSWKELISGKNTVTPSNISNNPTVDGDFSH